MLIKCESTDGKRMAELLWTLHITPQRKLLRKTTLMFACLSQCPSDGEKLIIIGIRLMCNKNKLCLSSNLSSMNHD